MCWSQWCQNFLIKQLFFQFRIFDPLEVILLQIVTSCQNQTLLQNLGVYNPATLQDDPDKVDKFDFFRLEVNVFLKLYAGGYILKYFLVAVFLDHICFHPVNFIGFDLMT